MDPLTIIFISALVLTGVIIIYAVVINFFREFCCNNACNRNSKENPDTLFSNSNLEELKVKHENNFSLDHSRLMNLAELTQKLNSEEVKISKSEKKELKKEIKHELKELDKEVKDKFTKGEIKSIKKEVKHAMKESLKHKTHLFNHSKTKPIFTPSQRVVLSPSI